MPSGTAYGACASLRCWAPTGLHRRRVSVVPIHTKSDSSSTRPRPRSICAWLQRASIFYERFGVRRSVDPDGPQADWGRAFLCVSRGARRLSLQSAQLHHQSHSGAETAAGFDVDEFVVVFLLRVWGGALVADAGIASQPNMRQMADSAVRYMPIFGRQRRLIITPPDTAFAGSCALHLAFCRTNEKSLDNVTSAIFSAISAL